MKKLLGFLAIAVLGGLVALGLNSMFRDKQETSSGLNVQNAQFTASTAQEQSMLDFVEVAKISTPAVVHIKTTIVAQQMQPDFFDPWGLFEHPRIQPREQQATGSGVIITEDGYIATNNHVVADAQKVEVVLDDKRTYIAEVIGTDPETDLALLKIDEDKLPFLQFGNSDELKVGEWVVAVGNPFNLTSTVTAGIVSAKGRNINLLRQNGGDYAIENFIQTDAAVNPGNSGGALVNTRGNLVGINTAIASRTGSYSGYSFAIPINLAKKILDDLHKYGEVKRAILGVRIQDITQELADEIGLESLNGVYIPQVMEDGAADKGNMKDGDVILSINGESINKSSELQEMISRYYPGDKIKVTVLRDGKKKDLNVKLLSREGSDKIDTSFKREELALLGAEFENLNRDEKSKLNIRHGVRISKAGGGVIASLGIKDGFVVTEIDRIPINNTSELKKLMESKKGAILLEGVSKDGERMAYALRLD